MISLARAVLSDMSSCTFMFEESVAFAFLVSSPFVIVCNFYSAGCCDSNGVSHQLILTLLMSSLNDIFSLRMC